MHCPAPRRNVVVLVASRLDIPTTKAQCHSILDLDIDHDLDRSWIDPGSILILVLMSIVLDRS